MKFAVVLSGCGQHDGSETHETVLTLLSLTQQNIEWQAVAPNRLQHHVTQHDTNTTANDEQRHCLTEAARLARGNIIDVSTANINDYDGVVIPGGFGAVTNLCDWADKGPDFAIEASVQAFLEQAIDRKLPMGFICIAPMLITKLFQSATLTIGNDAGIAEKITQLGSTHVDCAVNEVVVDEKHRVVSTPAYMLAKNIDQAYQGISKLVAQLVVLASN